MWFVGSQEGPGGDLGQSRWGDQALKTTAGGAHVPCPVLGGPETPEWEALAPVPGWPSEVLQDEGEKTEAETGPLCYMRSESGQNGAEKNWLCPVDQGRCIKEGHCS